MIPAIRLVTVEDNPADAAYIEALLEASTEMQTEQMSFERLVPALAHVSDAGADCMLVDLSLPDSDGLETITAIRNEHPHIPLVVLTGDSDRELGVRAIHSGADDFLDKNHIDEHVLIRTIRHCVERKRIAEQLSSSERHYRRLVEAAPDIVIRGRIVDAVAFDYVGPAVERILGVSTSAAHDPSVLWNTIHAEDRLLAAGPPWNNARQQPALTLRHVTASGAVVWLEPKLFVTSDPSTGVVEFEGLLRDVTAMKRSEQERLAMERRFRSAFAHSPVAMAITDGVGRIVDRNTAFSLLVGHRPVADMRRLISDADRLMRRGRSADNNQKMNSEHQLLLAEGSPVWLAAQITSLDGNTGETAEYLVQLNDITEGKRALNALEVALGQERQVVARLREVEQVRSDFVATVSHELRTPLTSVAGCLEMLRDSSDGRLDPEWDELISLMERGVQRLGSTVTNLLDFSRLEAGEIEYQPIPVDMEIMIQDAALVAAPTAEAKRVRLSIPQLDEDLPIVGEPAQIDRVLLNVISNAIKYTPSEGSVQVSGFREGDRIVVRVVDTGIGMSELDQEQLFTRFFRSTAAGVRNIQGTGLGLFIVKRIVEHHQGTIAITSQLGLGTTVEMTFPLAEVAENQGNVAEQLLRDLGQPG